MRRRLLAIGVPALAVALLLAAAAMTGNLRVAQLVKELAPAPAEVADLGADPGPVPPGGGPGSAQGADPIRAVLDGFHRLKLIADLSVRPAAVNPPQKRIIHFLDRRPVPQEEFSKVVTAAADKPLKANELRLKYADFVNRLNALQTHQQALLRLLARQYQLSSVYVECLTDENAPEWLSTIDELKQASAKIEERRPQ